MPTMLDLCCGLGGASAAMRARGWRVIGVDNLEAVLPDVVADARALPLRDLQLDLLWASIPCEKFAITVMPWHRERAALNPPDLSCALAVRTELEKRRPRVWVVECVRASRRWLSPIFGPVRAMVDGHVLWGNLPGLIPQFHRSGGRTKESFGPQKLRHQKRSIIPYEISLAVALATERRINELAV